MLIDGKRICLLGAEGCSELSGQPFIRDATDEEKETFYVEAGKWLNGPEPGPRAKDPKELNVDGNGRPYWIKIITDEAPDDLKTAAVGAIRCVRLIP